MGTSLPTITIITLLLSTSYGLTGYDCGGNGLNITSLSLLDIGRCEVDNIEPNKEYVYVQLFTTLGIRPHGSDSMQDRGGPYDILLRNAFPQFRSTRRKTSVYARLI